MMRFRTSLLVALALAVTAAFHLTSAQANRRLRSAFFEETPFASLAWVRNSKTRSDARSNLAVIDLTEEACINLPGTGIQWFMLNHRDPELAGQIGYFSVRILYRTDSSDEDSYPRRGLHVERNANWYEGEGQQARSHERNSEQIQLSEQDFIALHAPNKGEEATSLALLESHVGAWHMKPTVDGETSWSDRHLHGARLRAYLSVTTSAISARLIRFTATDSNSSGEPVVFWLDPLGATSALILIDAPRHDYKGSRRVYDVQFGGACP